MAKKKLVEQTPKEKALTQIAAAQSLAALRTLVDNMDVGTRNSLGAALALRMDALVKG